MSRATVGGLADAVELHPGRVTWLRTQRGTDAEGVVAAVLRRSLAFPGLLDPAGLIAKPDIPASTIANRMPEGTDGMAAFAASVASYGGSLLVLMDAGQVPGPGGERQGSPEHLAAIAPSLRAAASWSKVAVLAVCYDHWPATGGDDCKDVFMTYDSYSVRGV